MTIHPIKTALDKLGTFPPDWQQQPVVITPTEPSPPSVEYPRKWVALLTVPNQDEKASQALKWMAWGTPTQVYWPCSVQQVKAKLLPNGRHARVAQVKSIFPGFLFASIAIGESVPPGYDPWQVFRAAPSVRNWLRNGLGEPAYISEGDMEKIRRIENEQNAAPEAPTAHTFKNGDRIRFRGDLIDRWPAGKVREVCGDGRLGVEVPLLGRVVKIYVRPHQIEEA